MNCAPLTSSTHSLTVLVSETVYTAPSPTANVEPVVMGVVTPLSVCVTVTERAVLKVIVPEPIFGRAGAPTF